MKRPIGILLLAYTIGILIFEKVYIDSSFILLLLSISIIFLIYFKEKLLFLFIVFLFLGIFNTSKIKSKIVDDKKIKEIEIITYDVDEEKEISNCKIISIDGKKTNENVLIYEKLDLGYKYKLKGKFKEVDSLENFSFSYEKYLKSKNIFYEYEILTILEKEEGDDIFINLKRNFYSLVDSSLFDMSDEAKEISKSIILAKGDNETFEKMKNIGLAHMIAVSGSHINLIYSFLFSLGKIFDMKRRMLVSISLAIISFYAYFIGLNPSVLRALLMVIIMEIAIETKNIYDPVNALYFSILILLFKNPYNLYQTGLILSFVACLIIYEIYPRLKYLIPSERKNSEIYFILILQIFLLPIQLLLFGSFNLLSLVSNIVIQPIFDLILNLLVISLTVGSFIYLPFGIILEGLIKMMNFFVMIFDSIKFLNIDFFITKYECLGVYGFILFLFVFKRLRLEIKDYYHIFKIFLIFLPFIIYFSLPTMKVIMVDVGQGDSFIINKGNFVIMIDTGGSFSKSKGKRVVEDVKKLGIRHIDLLIITHDDWDHYGYYEIYKKKMDIKNIITSYEIEGVDSYIVRNKDSLSVKGLDIEFLIDENKDDSNGKSLVTLVKYNGLKLLFTGDYEYENNLEGIENLDILKVSHHGSNNGTKKEFLKRANPKLSFISVGKNNRYGHPSDEVVERLGNINSKIYRTDKLGSVIVDLDKNTIRSSRGKMKGNIFFSYLLFFYIFIKTILKYIYKK